MNYDQLCKLVLKNRHRLKDVKKTQLLICYYWDIWAQKKRKLKLGAVAFDLVDVLILGIPFDQTVEIRWIRQDTTDEDEMKLENLIKAFSWKWDFPNIAAFIIVMTFALTFIYFLIYLWVCENFGFLIFRNERLDEAFSVSMELILLSGNLMSFKTLYFLNQLLVEVFIRGSIDLNYIF